MMEPHAVGFSNPYFHSSNMGRWRRRLQHSRTAVPGTTTWFGALSRSVFSLDLLGTVSVI